MEKKIRIGLSIVVILGLLIPMNEEWPIGLAFYLITGTLMAVFEIIPALLSTPWILIQDISASPSLNSIKEILLYIPFQIGTLFWIYALPILFLWNLYLIKPRSSKIQNIYRVGLLVSLASSIYRTYIHPIHVGAKPGLGYWANPILLLVATGFEIWIWLRERRMKTLA